MNVPFFILAEDNEYDQLLFSKMPDQPEMMKENISRHLKPGQLT